MNLKLSRGFKYFLLCISMAFLLPFAANAGVEENIVETKTGFYYVVQKGDTLWDLSEKFADSPWLWPDLWQYNPDIPNPHLIYPGQKIQIYKKEWRGMAERPVDVEPAVEPPAPDEYYQYSEIDAIGFIRETEADHFGSVIKVKEDKRLISYGDKMFIAPADNGRALVEGNLYAVYRTSGPIDDPVTGDYVGIQHIITGIAEVIQVENDFAVAEIVTSYRDTREGDVVMPLLERSEDIKLRDAVSGLRGRMIKAEDGQALIGEHMLAFINKGENDDVRTGQIYSFYYQETAPGRNNFETLMLTEERLGEMIVLHTENTTSTVLITNSLDHIPAGTAFKSMDD